MRAVIQRVSRASVTVEGEVVGRIDHGLAVLLGVADGDSDREAAWMAQKIAGLRVFEDHGGKMNQSLVDVGGALLVVSQFTLLGDCRKGRRPSFVGAAEPGEAERLYERFCDDARALGVPVETGRFRTTMTVELANEGPVTLIVETPGRGDS